MHEGNGTGGTSLPSAAGGSAGFKVNEDNVLQIARAVQDQAKWLYAEIDACSRDMQTEPARQDPVSKDVAKALNRKLVDDPDSYINRAIAYAEELSQAVEQMKAAAKTYGFTDQDITTALNGPVSPRV
ncbi:hypothetical protein [Crossiella cryophila]|uniref:PE family protein n=1 Tax=Crossiella cryophila TaxID=43355 RepID=A0A7W7C9W1_9PSEU|nr:hypothetical protein [Crossiella cryophila]MBB4677219.1 hypothetical protein [Crossiella cryophila]